MPQFRRVLIPAVALGVASLLVTFLTAAKEPGDDTKPAPVARKGEVSGVVVYGYVDVEGGLIPIFPKDFPNPSEVVEVLKKEGDKVTKGEVLVKFNTDLTQIRLEKAKAGLKQANALVAGATKAVEGHTYLIRTQEAAVQAKAFEAEAARIELDKAKNDKKRNLGVTDSDIRAGEEKVKALDQATEVERRKLDGYKQIPPTFKLDEALAKAEELKSTIKEAEYALRFATLTSDHDGVILRANVHVGTTFGPQTRQPAFLIQPKAPLLVRLEVDQEFAHRVATGMKATIYNDPSSTIKWTGKVTQVPDAFLPKRNPFGTESLLGSDTRILECLVSIDPVTNGPRLRLGQKVRVEVGME
jgi:HlyD family secretion protein